MKLNLLQFRLLVMPSIEDMEPCEETEPFHVVADTSLVCIQMCLLHVCTAHHYVFLYTTVFIAAAKQTTEASSNVMNLITLTTHISG